MPTTITSAVATQDSAGNIASLTITGSSDACPGGTLSIQVFDANSGELIAMGNAPYDGAVWTKTLTVPDDISADQIACDQVLQIQLFCRQNGTTTQLALAADTVDVECQATPCSITIISAAGVPSVGASGLDELTVTGTASCTSVTVVAVRAGGNESVTTTASVTNGSWTAVFRMGDPGVGTNLKAFECGSRPQITATCENDTTCTVTQTLPIACGGDCTFDADITVLQASDGTDLGTPNVTCDDSAGGDYSLRVSAPGGGQVTILSWTSSSSVSGDSTVLQDAAGNNITSNPLPVSVSYPDGEAFNISYTALARDSQGCLGVATATFSCGGEIDPNAPVDCQVSDWSNWSPCINGEQRRTRTVVTQPRNGGRRCPALEETRACPPEIIDCEVSAWSAWSECRDGSQRRTREVVVQPQNGGRPCPELEQTRDCEIRNGICDPCCIWNWINIALFFATAIVVLITLCMLSAVALGAIAALASGGTLAGVWAVLTAAEVAMLIISGALLLISLISWILWLIICLPNNPNACSMLETLMVALSFIVAISFVLMWILIGVGMLGCAIGALIDFGWFGFILAITTLIYTALGCFDQD